MLYSNIRRRSPSPWSGESSNGTVVNTTSDEEGGPRIKRRGPCLYCKARRKRCYFPYPGARSCSYCIKNGFFCQMLPRVSLRSRGRRQFSSIAEDEEPEDIAENLRIMQALTDELEIRLPRSSSSISSGNSSSLTSLRSETEVHRLITQAREIIQRANLSTRPSSRASTVRMLNRTEEDERSINAVSALKNLDLGGGWVSGALPMSPPLPSVSQQGFFNHPESPLQPLNLPPLLDISSAESPSSNSTFD